MWLLWVLFSGLVDGFVWVMGDLFFWLILLLFEFGMVFVNLESAAEAIVVVVEVVGDKDCGGGVIIIIGGITIITTISIITLITTLPALIRPRFGCRTRFGLIFTVFWWEFRLWIGFITILVGRLWWFCRC